MPIKKLHPAELKERRDKRLCFNCNEKFGPGHRCKNLFLIGGCWSDEEDNNDVDMEIVDQADEAPESLYTLGVVQRLHIP